MHRLFFITLFLCFLEGIQAQKWEYHSCPNQVHDILIDKDKLWVATNVGLLEMDSNGKLLKKHGPLDGLLEVKQLIKYKRKLYAFYEKEVWTISDGRWQEESPFPAGTYLVKTHNQQWLVNENELQYNEGGNWIDYPLPSEFSADVSAIAKHILKTSKGELYMMWENSDGRYLKQHASHYKGGEWSGLGENTPPSVSLFRDVLAEDRNSKRWGWSGGEIVDFYSPYNSTDEKNSPKRKKMSKEIGELIIRGRGAFFQDSKRNLWFRVRGPLKQDFLIKYDGESWTATPNFIEGRDSQFRPFGSEWEVIREDEKGNLWLAAGNAEGRIFKYDGESWITIPIWEKRVNQVVDLFEDSDNNWWFAGSTSEMLGLVKYDGDSYSTPQKALKMSFFAMLKESMLEDSEGNLLLLGEKAICVKEKGKEWTKIPLETYPKFMFVDKQENLNVVFDEKLVAYKKLKEQSSFSLPEMSSEGSTRSHFYDKRTGILWLASSDRIMTYSDGQLLEEIKLSEEPFKQIRWKYSFSIQAGADGVVWVCFEDARVRFDGKKRIVYNNENLPERIQRSSFTDYSRPIIIDKKGGEWWMNGSSIFEMVEEKWKKVEGSEVLSSGFERGYYTQAGFCDSKGSLWFAAPNGIFKLSAGKLEKMLDCPALSYRQIEEDRKGNLWFFTDGSGYFVYNPK